MRSTGLKDLSGCLASMLLGTFITLSVFGLSLALAWIAILEKDTSLRLWGVVLAGALGIFSGSLAVGLLGHSNRIRRALIFSLLFSMLGFTYLFTFSQVTAVFAAVGGILGLMAGVMARVLRGLRANSRVDEAS